MAERIVNVEWHRLQRNTVPMICAKTGVPTTHLRRHLLVQRRHVPLWMWLLVAPATLLLLSKLLGHRAKIVLPTTSAVRWKHWALRALLLAWFLFGGWLVARVLTGTWVVAGVWVFGIVALYQVQRAAWVRPRWFGIVQLRNPHPEFVSAVRTHVEHQRFAMPQPMPVVEPVAEPVAETAANPAPGWYPDPGGVHAARWYDGSAWTEHVVPHS